jgi:arsenate reductase (thioredoxin)
MKFFKHESKKSVSFVCVQNAGRSQMAEGFFKKYAPKEYEGISAGTMPVSEINPLAVEVMREVDIDISGQNSKEITEDMIRNSSKIVNMGCMDKVSCPTLFLQNLLDWNIEDPKGKQIDKVREIRDEIEQRVKELVADIKNYQ